MDKHLFACSNKSLPLAFLAIATPPYGWICGYYIINELEMELMKIKYFLLLSAFLFGCILLAITQVIAETISVKNSPRPFTVVAPTSWIQKPTTTGNSRIKFTAPSGTPAAECAVIVQEYPSAKNIPQPTLDKGMTEGLDPSEITSQLSSLYNNVKVFSVGVGNISGHPAQLVNCQYSVGTPTGEIWGRGIMVTAATTPGLIWIISCGALGKSAADAQKGYSYWQLEIAKFPTNIKIVQ